MPKTTLDLPAFNNVSLRVKALSACVFDDDLRGLSEQVVRGIGAGVEEGNWSHQPEHMKTALKSKNQFHDQVNSQLKKLSDPPY